MVSDATESFDSGSSSSDSSHLPRNNNPNNNRDDDDNGEHSGSSSDTDASPGPLNWIVTELKKIETKAQMENLIEQIQLKDIDFSLYQNTNELDVPIILLMKLKHRWLGIGQFFCPYCESVFKTSASLHNHWKSSHEDKNVPQEQAALEFITGRKIRWKISSPHLPAESLNYRTIHVCPFSGCEYFVSRANSLSAHISSAHQDLEALRREVGVFWSMHILHARRTSRLLLVKDFCRDTRGSLCKVSLDFICKDRITVKQHSNRSHPHSNVEGNVDDLIDVNITAKWLSPSIDDDEISASNVDLAKEKDLRKEGEIQQDKDRNQPVAARSDDSVDF